jgi:hypothetical protein
MIVSRGLDSQSGAEDVVHGPACQKALDAWENDGGYVAPQGNGGRSLGRQANEPAGHEHEPRITVTLSTKVV